MAPAPPLFLPPPGSTARWAALQQLRRQRPDPEPWLAALEAGRLAAEPDLLAALAVLVDQGGARRLLALDAGVLLAALAAELVVWSAAATALWLEPLLAASAAGGPLAEAPGLLPLLGRCRDRRVARRLRQALAGAAAEPSADPALWSLLGHQRQPEDLPLLLQRASAPGPRAVRRAALEGLALGLGAWPPQPLRQGLTPLVTDLDPLLAAEAVDLLARLPQGVAALRALRGASLDPGVRQRLARRLASARRPLLLLVHGRSGGVIPAELQQLAAELAARRGAPVQLLALSGGPQEPSPELRQAAAERGGAALVPLLLLPGGHVRRDLPALAARWRPLQVQRYPFLGAWPGWQQLLAQLVAEGRRNGQQLLWLHHPLEAPLPARYLAHLAHCSGAAVAAAPYTADAPWQSLPAYPALVWQPLALAANRLSDALAEGLSESAANAPGGARPPLRPPLLQQPPVRQFLLQHLEALP